jgi:hypothetical protein
MTTQTEDVRSLFDRVLETMRKTTEANLQAQQEMLRHCTTGWPGYPSPQTGWSEKVRQFRKDWSTTAMDLLARHRKMIDEQYRLGTEALEDALQAAEAESPEEFRKRAEAICRKSLDCMKEISETQTREFQKAITKWIELATKVG